MTRKQTPSGGTEKDDDGRKGIRSIPVAISVLEGLVTLGQPSALREISELADLTPSRAHRYLSGLAESGLVRQDPESGQYDIGEKLVELGLHALSRISPIKIGVDLLKEVASEVGLDSHFTVWSPNGPTVMRWQQGKMQYAVKVPEGRSLSLLDTATGRVYLSYLPSHETRDLLQREIDQWNAKPGGSFLTEHGLEGIFAAVRQHGMAAAIGNGENGVLDVSSPTFYREMNRGNGISALAVPVFMSGSRLSMVVTVIGVVGSFDVSPNGEIAKKLKAITAAYSQQLGM